MFFGFGIWQMIYFKLIIIDMILFLFIKVNQLYNSFLFLIEINDKCILKLYIVLGCIFEFIGQ